MCDNEGTTTSIPVTPHLTPLRYVFLPTVDLFHVALGDFAFLSPAVPRLLVKKGTATVNCERIPLDELVSTVITVPHRGHGGQPDATYNLCLGCLIRGLYSGDAPIRGGFASPPQRVKDTLFVFPVGQRVVTDVLEIGRRRGRCPECDANFKATQRWSEAGVMFSRDNRFQLVSPVIVPYDRREEYAPFTEKRDLMYAGFLRSNPRVPMWNFELPHPLDGWPVSNYFPDIAPKVTFVTDGLTAVALYQDSKEVRNLLHGVRIRFCEAIVEAEQRGLTGRAMDDALLDSPLWSTEERFVVQYLVWMWPMAQFRPQHGAVGAGLPLSFVDHLMSPLPPLESAKKRVDAVVCKILRKAIPVKGNAFFEGVVQRECMIAHIPDWATLRDHVLLPLYYAPSASIVRPPRIECRRGSNGGDNADSDDDSDSDDSNDGGGGGGRRVRSIALVPHLDKDSTSLLMLDIRQDAPAFVTSPNGHWHAALFVLKRDLFYTCLSKDYLDGNVVGVNNRQTVPKAGTLRVVVTQMPSSPFMHTPGQHWAAWNGVSNYTISDEPRVICMTRERPAYRGEPHLVIYVASPRDEADERVLAIFDADAWEGGEDQQIPKNVRQRIVHAWHGGGVRSIDAIIDMWFDSLNMHATSLWTSLAECTELAFREGLSNQQEIATIVDRFFLFATPALTRDGVIDAVLHGVTGIRSRRHRALRPAIERSNVELDLSIAVDELTTDIEPPTRAEMAELLAHITSRPPSALPLWFVTAKGTAVETRIVQMMLKQRERFRQRLRVFASTKKAHLFKQMVLVFAAGQRHADFNEFLRVVYDFDGRFPTWPLRETWNMQILRAEAEWLVNGTHELSRNHNSLDTLEKELLFFR